MTRRNCSLLLAALLTLSLPAFGGPGHDHGDAPAARAGDGPQRLADGSVMLPKPAQRQLDLRTLPSHIERLPRALELSGQVLMDPNAGGRVQPMQTGRIEAGPEGLPAAGQRVKRGDVLAWVVPASDALERAGQQAQLAELRAQRTVAAQRVTRLRQLADSVPRKDIDAAAAELSGLDARIRATAEGLNGREPLVAPVDGVIAHASVVAGQVVDAREQVFAIVDPARMHIEALAYEPERVTRITSGSVGVGAERIELRHVGTDRVLRGQALPIRFAAVGGALDALALGQTVRVQVTLAETLEGMRIPSAALVRNPSNQTIVWVKTAPERFEPRVVRSEPLDGTHVAVTAGLADGDRVVVQAAALLNQIR